MEKSISPFTYNVLKYKQIDFMKINIYTTR